MLAMQRMMDSVANNLANASTTGYKRDVLVFNDSFWQAVYGGKNDSLIGAVSAGPDAPYQATSFEVGSMRTTGSPLDIALSQPNQMFAVRAPSGVLYSRNGSFHVDNQGVLVNVDGLPVLDESKNPIQLPPGQVQIEPNGSILSGGQEVAKLGIYEGAFSKAGSNLYSGANVKPVADPDLHWKTLEDSNVNTIESMIEMITLGRSFEMAQKSIQSQDEQTQKLIESLQNR